MSDHPSDEASEDEKKTKKTLKQMQEAKPISTYIPDPLDLPVDLIISDRFRQQDG
jgi:hypothetical protein